MSIEDQNTIDAIGVDQDGVVVLTISDHLDWDDEHLLLLQEKLNRYLAFLESGEVSQAYQGLKDRELKINVVCKYELNPAAKEFMSRCAEIINQAGFGFGHEVHI